MVRLDRMPVSTPHSSDSCGEAEPLADLSWQPAAHHPQVPRWLPKHTVCSHTKSSGRDIADTSLLKERFVRRCMITANVSSKAAARSLFRRDAALGPVA